MRKTVSIIAAAVAALTSTIGMAAENKTFVYEGNTYVYSTAEVDGRQVITGRRLPSGQQFRLTVRDGRVSGVSGGVPVSFRTTEAAGAAGGMASVSR